MKRYLDCSASDLISVTKPELLASLKASEGRILVSENITSIQPLLVSITNAELAASQGADLLLLNLFDADNPQIMGLPDGVNPTESIRTLKTLTGRIIGVNLEAVETGFKPQHEDFWAVKKGRLATPENAEKLAEMGVSFITITGNPGNGVSNASILENLSAIRQRVGDKIILITGRMHAAGILGKPGEKLITPEDVEAFIEHGADIVLLPAPGTVPGITQDYAEKLVECAHKKGAMTMTTIGTSQEGADIDTIKRIALMCKMIGTDLHHIGDTGYAGLALPENIRAYSIAIRGVRHTYSRMARSVNR